MIAQVCECDQLVLGHEVAGQNCGQIVTKLAHRPGEFAGTAGLEHRLLSSNCSHQRIHLGINRTMKDIWQSLRAAFTEGHRQIADGLQSMIQAVQRNDFETVITLADQLDRQSGPHIEFEERYLYPIVEQEAGEAYATRLYDEHDEVIATLMELKRFDPLSEPTDELKKRWLDGLKKGLEHSTDSDTLIQYLGNMPSDQKEQLLQRHHRLCSRGHRWSQLHPDLADHGTTAHHYGST